MILMRVIFTFFVFIFSAALAASLFLVFSYSFMFILLAVVLIFFLVVLIVRGAFFIYPFMEWTSRILKVDPNIIKRSIIDYNNYKMFLNLKKGLLDNASQILVILPHCIQNGACLYRVTWDKLENCRLCGKCCIPKFLELKRTYGVDVAVVSGGTAARELVKQKRPRAVIAVACENDLVSGLRDVQGIPVFAVLNQRPAGPCRDTTVDVDTVKAYILRLIK